MSQDKLVLSGSEERYPRRCQTEGEAYVDDSDGCDNDFYRCENKRFVKYVCDFPGVFNEDTKECVHPSTIRACRYD